MPTYKIDHLTEYEYTQPVIYSNHLAYMLPRPVSRQKWKSYDVDISPDPTAKQYRDDIYGNKAMAFSIEEEHSRFSFKTTGIVEVTAEEPPANSPSWEEVAKLVSFPKDEDSLNASMYTYASPFARFEESVKRYAEESFTPGRPIFDASKELMTRIYTDCTYTPGYTRIGAQPQEILRGRKGVCQDFAHLMIGCLRSLHLPCRYISGYLRTHPPKGQPKLIGADATHAWVSSFIPGHGWVEFDPTNNVLGGDEHIILAWGRDFGDVSPLKGVITGGGNPILKVSVNVDEYSPQNKPNLHKE